MIGTYPDKDFLELLNQSQATGIFISRSRIEVSFCLSHLSDHGTKFVSFMTPDTALETMLDMASIDQC